MARISVTVCFVLFIISLKEPCEANPFVVVKKYYDIAMAVYNGIEKINNAAKEGVSTQLVTLKQDVLRQLDRVNDNIENVKYEILTTIKDTLKLKISDKIDELFDHIKNIESSFKQFYENFTNKTIMSRSQLKKFADESTGYGTNSLPRNVEKMHEAFVDCDYTKHESVISIIAKDSKAADTICIKGFSSQQLIYDLYNIIAKVDAKALMVKLYAYDILKEREQDNIYDAIKVQEEEKHLIRLNKTFEMVKNFMHIASREVWRCDPPKLEKGSNYGKLQEVFQGYFLSKRDLTSINKLHEIGGVYTTLHKNLWTKCHELKDERLRCDSAVCEAQPPNKICKGHIRDCEFIANKVQVCHAPAYDDRRYIWAHLLGTDIYYANHSLYCPDTQGMIGQFPEDICYCNCESEKREELRYFSLLESTSDIHLNKVVTGVRFVIENYIFHIQIQQGVLSKEGTIVGNTEWKEISHIPHNELINTKISKHILKTLSDPGQKYRYDEWTEWYKNDLVYTVHYNQKTVFLDDFDSDGSKLVTGLRFKQVDDALRLEVRMTPFNYATGELDVDTPNQWQFNQKTKHDRPEITLEFPNDPKLSKPSTVFSESSSRIDFRITDLKKDVGQNTIPFIDLQSVVTISEIPFPLSGVGIFHRHDERTGGFLAFKIHHYDYTPHISLQ